MLVVSTTVLPKFKLVDESVAVICGGVGWLLPPAQPARIIAIAAQDKTKNMLRIALSMNSLRPTRALGFPASCNVVNGRDVISAQSYPEVLTEGIPMLMFGFIA